MSPLGFNARLCRLICTSYMFPEIHLWYNTWCPLCGQHASWAVLFHIPVSRYGWGLKLGLSSVWDQPDTLLTEPCWLDRQKLCFNVCSKQHTARLSPILYCAQKKFFSRVFLDHVKGTVWMNNCTVYWDHEVPGVSGLNFDESKVDFFRNIKEWKNSTCWLELVVIVK